MTISTDQTPTSSVLAGVFPAGTATVTIGASIVASDFGDVNAEYAALRESAAKVDLSGAGLVQVNGGDAYDLLQTALARDLEFVTPEQSLISLLMDEDGKAIDLVTAYYAEEGFRLETSTGSGPATAAHLAALAASNGYDAEVSLINDQLTMILIEGPEAAKVIEETIDPDLGALPLSGLMQVEFQGADLIVSRSGFTGEYGYKLFVPTSAIEAVWAAIDIPAAGQTALEAAMFEVRQPVLHLENTGASALESGYSWLIDITKETFVGRDAVQSAFDAGVRSTVIGFKAPEATAAPAAGAPIEIGGVNIGKVVMSLFSPGRQEYIGLAQVRGDLAAPSLDVTIGGDDAVAATTLAAPYFLPISWKTR
jgi:glycine cleavage system aminomethyltransferase T